VDGAVAVVLAGVAAFGTCIDIGLAGVGLSAGLAAVGAEEFGSLAGVGCTTAEGVDFCAIQR
jgi:hypothetical protein